MKRSILLLLGALAVASCDSPSGPKPAGAPAHVDVVSGNAQTAVAGAGLGSPLVVKVTDAKGKPVSGQAVQYQVTAGGGSLSSNSATTGSDGQAQVTWTLGTVARDTQKVEARVLDSSGGVLASAIFKAVALPDVPAALTKVSGDAQVGAVGAAVADSLAVKLADRFGNVISGQAVTFAVTSGGGSVSPATRTTDSTGVAKTRWTLGVRVDSAQTVSASFGSLAPATFAATATVAGTLAKVGGDGQTGPVGHVLADSLAVRLTSAGGAPVAGATIRWTSTSGSLVPATSTTDANGTAKAAWLLGGAAGAQTARAELVGGTATASFSATALAGPAERLVVAGGNAQRGTPGAPLADSLAVRAVDHDGNPVAGVQVSWSVQQGGGSVSPASSTTGAGGVAKASWTLGGADSVQAARADLAGGTGVAFSAALGLQSTVFTKVAGDHQTGAAGTVLPDSLAVRLSTPAGAPLPGVTVQWVPYDDGVAVGAAASPASSVTGADGVAKTTWKLPSGVSQATMRMRVYGAYADTAFRATVLPGAPASLSVPGDTSFHGTPGSVLTVAVRVADASGMPVPGAQVQWAVVAGGGSVAPAATTADASGIARVQWTLGPADGTNTLEASVPGVPAVQLYAAARTTGSMTLQVLAPYRHAPDQAYATVEVKSTAIVSSVTVQVQGRTAALTQTSSTRWGGAIDLTGLPFGSMQAKFTAVDVLHDTAVAVATFAHDNPPVLTVATPLQYRVARPTIHVVADCTDDDPAGCAYISVHVNRADNPVVQQRGGHFEADVPLSAWVGKRVQLEVRALDSGGLWKSAFYDSVAVEPSTALVPVQAVGGPIVDADAGRILYLNKPVGFSVYPSLIVRDRATGAEQTVFAATQYSDTAVSGRLTANGVLYVNAAGLWEWKTGTSTQLTRGAVHNRRLYGDFTDASVRGRFVLYHQPDGTLVRRDVLSGTEVSVDRTSVPLNQVNEAGDVFYMRTSGELLRWRDGTAVLVDSVGTDPWVSGDTVAYLHHTAVYLSTPAVLVVLSPYTGAGRGAGYQASGSWAAYTYQRLTPDGGVGTSEVWVRDPAGTRTLAVPFNATIASLGASGDLVTAAWDWQNPAFYVGRAPYSSAPTRIATLADRFFWIGGTLYESLGGELFRVTY